MLYFSQIFLFLTQLCICMLPVFYLYTLVYPTSKIWVMTLIETHICPCPYPGSTLCVLQLSPCISRPLFLKHCFIKQDWNTAGYKCSCLTDWREQCFCYLAFGKVSRFHSKRNICCDSLIGEYLTGKSWPSAVKCIHGLVETTWKYLTTPNSQGSVT